MWIRDQFVVDVDDEEDSAGEGDDGSRSRLVSDEAEQATVADSRAGMHVWARVPGLRDLPSTVTWRERKSE